jgi:hypothetical protein
MLEMNSELDNTTVNLNSISSTNVTNTTPKKISITLDENYLQYGGIALVICIILYIFYMSYKKFVSNKKNKVYSKRTNGKYNLKTAVDKIVDKQRQVLTQCGRM